MDCDSCQHDQIIAKLRHWEKHPEVTVDDGIPPLSVSSIRLAIELVDAITEAGLQPPDRVVSMVNGGVALDFLRDQETEETVALSPDGCCEYWRFEGERLAQRRIISQADALVVLVGLLEANN